MQNFQNSANSLTLIECELSGKFRRKEIVKKIKSEKSPILEIEISCLKLYDKFEEHLKEILQTNPASISVLSLILNEIEIDERIYKTISQNISKFDNLNTLAIELSAVNLSNNGIKGILYEIVDLDLLKTLSIDVSNNSMITNDCAQYFGLSISQLTQLQNLSLNFNGCTSIDQKFIDKFTQLIKRMISLREVDLHIASTSINEFTFFINLAQIQNLSNISISYHFTEKEQQQNFVNSIDILSTKIQCLSLQINHINRGGNDSSEFFKQLGKKLNQFAKLNEFCLNSESTNQDIDIYHLMRSMADVILKGLNLFINVNEQQKCQKYLQLAKQQQLQYLRIIALYKLNSHFQHYLYLLY